MSSNIHKVGNEYYQIKIDSILEYKELEYEVMFLKLSTLANYKPRAGYSSPRAEVIDMIIKKGYARYEAEALFDSLWKLYDRNPQKIAKAIAELSK